MRVRRQAERPSWMRPSGLVEFEHVSLRAANAIANELPSGVENMLDRVPGYWHKIRKLQTKRDFALMPLTIEWLRTLPKEIWPLQTGAMYPRVLNRLAQAWADRDERDVNFDELLNSRRRNRRGFPAEVQHELQALHLFAVSLSE